MYLISPVVISPQKKKDKRDPRRELNSDKISEKLSKYNLW